MTVFKTYFKLLRSSSITLLIYVIVFLVMLFVFNSDSQSYNSKPLCYLVVKDNSEVSKGISNYIEENTKLVTIENESVEDALFYSDIDIYILMEEDFSTNYNFTINCSKDSIAAANFQSNLQNYTGMVKTYLENDLATIDNVFLLVNDTLNVAATQSEIVLSKTSETHQSSFYSFAGYIMSALIIISINAIMISYKSLEVKRRINMSPYSKNKFSLELLLGHLIIIFVYLSLVYLLAFIFVKDQYYQNLQFVNLFIYSLIFVVIGMLINELFNSKAALNALSTVIPLSGAFLGGLFVGIDLMSDSVIRISKLTPQYYYLLNSMSIAKNGHLNTNYTLIQGGFILIFVVCIIVVSNLNRKKEN